MRTPIHDTASQSEPLLMERMKAHGCSPRFISIIGSLFFGGSSRATVNGEMTESILRKRGLFQGSLLAPFLYNLYSNNMYEHIVEQEVETIPRMMAFADDIALPVAKGENEWSKAQTSFDGVQEWAVVHSMSVNARKSGVVMKGGPRVATSNRFAALAELQVREERRQRQEQQQRAKQSFVDLFGQCVQPTPVAEELSRDCQDQDNSEVLVEETTESIPSVVTKNGDVIESVPSYKYLGVDVGANGIQVASTFERMVSKALTALSLLEARGGTWGPGLKLHVYRTFVRPTLEYAAPLVYTYMQAYPSAKLTAAWVEAQKVHERALVFITGGTHVRNKVIHLAMLALETTEQRFSYLRDSFQAHLDRICESDTIVGKCRRRLEDEPRPTRDRSLMVHFGKSGKLRSYERMVAAWSEYQDWKHEGRIMRRNPNNPGSTLPFVAAPSFKTFSRLLLLDEHQVKSPLARYILAKSRTGHGLGVDKVVNISDKGMRRLLMDWRRNQYGFRRGRMQPECPRGGHEYRRTCMKRCSLIMQPNVEDCAWQKYLKEEREFEARWQDASGYTIIDSLINNQEFKEAARILNMLYIRMYGSITEKYLDGFVTSEAVSSSSQQDPTLSTRTHVSNPLQTPSNTVESSQVALEDPWWACAEGASPTSTPSLHPEITSTEPASSQQFIPSHHSHLPSLTPRLSDAARAQLTTSPETPTNSIPSSLFSNIPPSIGLPWYHSTIWGQEELPPPPPPPFIPIPGAIPTLQDDPATHTGPDSSQDEAFALDERVFHIDLTNPTHTPRQRLQYQQEVLEGLGQMDRSFLTRRHFELLLEEADGQDGAPGAPVV